MTEDSCTTGARLRRLRRVIFAGIGLAEVYRFAGSHAYCKIGCGEDGRAGNELAGCVLAGWNACSSPEIPAVKLTSLL